MITSAVAIAEAINEEAERLVEIGNATLFGSAC